MEGFTKRLSWGWDKDTKIMAKILFTELLKYYFRLKEVTPITNVTINYLPSRQISWIVICV